MKIKSKIIPLLISIYLMTGCAQIPAPTWNQVTDQSESEYSRYFTPGTAALSGQAFLTQSGGGVVKAAGRTVTLDPATSTGNEWWAKAGKIWVNRGLVPPSPAFLKARRTTVADADGKFKFTELPVGKYYVRTEVTWEVGGYTPTQGGIVGDVVDIGAGQNKEVVLNQYPQ